MNTRNSQDLTTPKRIKRLGLRRSSRIINDSAKTAVASLANLKTAEVEYPACSTVKRTLSQSDVKINYKNLEYNNANRSDECHASGMDTPKNASSTNLLRLTASTNCRPYRLALSKKVRERMTKRRLEFYLANEMERDGTEEKQVQNKKEKETTNATGIAFNSREELLQQIEMARKEMSSRQEYLKKVAELKEAINIWKTGFSLAVHDLQEKFEPRLDITSLLEHLHIPPEMIKYIDD